MALMGDVVVVKVELVVIVSPVTNGVDVVD